ncbi:MAG: hypothetical protein JWO63_2347 [Frankiales bacterium]|nr:hypothetical protein [Frankiales bacterium]
MRTLLDLLLAATMLVAVGCVIVALLIRRATRRLRRAAWALLAWRRPTDRRLGGWKLSPLAVGDFLAARAQGPAMTTRALLPGAAGTVWRVRRDLRREVTAAAQALRLSRRAGRPVDGLDGSVAALARQAQDLDLDLRLIAAEPDRRVRARMLAGHAARAKLIQRTCAQVRTALLAEGSASNETTLQRVVEEAGDAVSAAQSRARAYRDLSRR